MKFYSTKNKDYIVDLKTAVLQSLPPDNGLYMPTEIPVLTKDFINSLQDKSFQDIAYAVAYPYLSEDFTGSAILDIVDHAINFEAPLISLDDQLKVLELWHGPSLAFKDFGARFMAAVMGKFVEGENKQLTILVATSGDTGGAVAAGFLGVEGVDVVILYPKGKVSPLQEKQLTTLGQNITALEVDGTFDDCQALVKSAFLDDEINQRYYLSSANSINISRLIPQAFYYFEALKQLGHTDQPVNFCIPSGNFGNLTAGLLAKQMGLPMNRFIAATNANDIIPQYLETGIYTPRPSTATISNAMDVGNPSNFRRMENLYGHVWNAMKKDIVGYAYNDAETNSAVKEVHDKYAYVIDPHGAVGYLAAIEYQIQYPNEKIIILETAHPAKFLPVMNPILGEIKIPERLAILSDKEKVATTMSIDFADFKNWLLQK
jgi:threonine synthase